MLSLELLWHSREEDAKQRVGNRDHDGKGSRLERKGGGIVEVSGMKESVQRVSVREHAWGSCTAVQRMERGQKPARGKYWRTEKQQGLAVNGAAMAQRRHL